ncbi:MAG: RNA polymerase subunit sigma [Verrucomicrobiales bacterium]|nr:RNA polymerase subunit sigma [Verrucomicrobiales bacterium]
MSNDDQMVPVPAPATFLTTEELIPLVYDELRRIAARRIAGEESTQSLQATALVHEAYLRLGNPCFPKWEGRAHFFGAAAEAMRRILVERARRRHAAKRGGGWRRVDWEQADVAATLLGPDLLAVSEALDQLAEIDANAAQLVTLRFFAGLGHQEAAELLGVSRRVADRMWTYARAWLVQTLQAAPGENGTDSQCKLQ